MKVSNVYKKGGREINEDACVMNEKAGIYAAVDGATGLDGVPGYIASHAVKEELNKATDDHSLFSYVKLANERVQKETMNYYEANIKKSSVTDFLEIPKIVRSSTALAAIKVAPDYSFLEYVQAADCMLFLQYETGAIRMVTHDLLQDLDSIAIHKLVEKRERSTNRHLGLGHLREMVNPILLENRSKANTYGGYGVIDGGEEALDFLERGRISLNRVSRILLVSDGLLLPQKLDEPDAWIKTADLAFSDGLDQLVKEVEKREDDDPHCVTYPRFKKMDDKTGILIEF
ncbi:hypothetical protein GCM10011409_27880 [Lentibacillus populi]|uniref:PPM-type phosphatase domain-containing protein n=1 Tax=Lentibacillus populi TaxID=1827502 RepID=A0A9W5X642_9BACI|nr:hypothetical protein [Lentibacillus populi]MBT2215570.1 hypothetical protein [Virgibacillus dakarensis]GGB48722.1 hypothetical protein GCM10011409_27880 [Lentibacillus populi]